MKIPRKFLTLLLLAVAVAAFGLAQTFKVIASRNLDLVRQDLQKVFGSDLQLDGLEVSLFPRPGFSAKGIRVADDPRFAATPIVRTEELVLGVNLWNLLQGRLLIDSLVFKEPELQIITDEEGTLNLTAMWERRKGLRSFPPMTSTTGERRPAGLRFAIRETRIKGGRIEYLDRSVPAPAELRVRNVDLTLRGFNPTETLGIRFAAALSEGLGHDVRIDGEVGPQEANKTWSQRPMDLAMRFDSLYMPVIARAIAALRDRFPRALNVTGPMALEAKVSGTFERPKIEDISLKIPLFGSSDYNAVATGTIAFSERRSWAAAELDGKLSITSVDLARLRDLPFLEQLLSPEIKTEGAVNIFSRFEGTWETLRAGALMVADKSEIRFYNWLRKPAGVSMTIKTAISRHKEKIRFHESEFVLGAVKTKFAGSLETEPVPRLSLQFNGGPSSLTGWSPLLAPWVFLATDGNADWQVTVDKNFTADDDPWNLLGDIRLTGAELRHKENRQRIERLSGRVSFLGRPARLDDVMFRVGSSEFSLSAFFPDLYDPRVQFQLSSQRLNSADLPPLGAGASMEIKEVSGHGEMQWETGHPVLSGSLQAAEGSLGRTGFRDLRTQLVWSAERVAFENLSAKIFEGFLHGEGHWSASDEKSRQLELAWQAEGIDVNLLLTEWMPVLKDRLEGRLSGRGKLKATGSIGAAGRDALNGAGEITIHRGAIKNFNLVRQLLLRGGGVSESQETIGRWPAVFSDLVKDRNTSFNSWKASFVLEPQRIHADNLIITTSDYTLTGAGWTALDRATRWNGLLVLSPRLSQEIQREYRALRYLLDRRGRLAISFRMEGTIPNVKIRLENRILSQLLRGGAASEEGGSEGEESEADKPSKDQLPDTLERFLNR